MNRVLVYSTPSCPFCHMAKDYLKSKGVDFEDFDVASNSAKAGEMITKSNQMGVPVLDINGEIIVGYDKERIDKLLGL